MATFTFKSLTPSAANAKSGALAVGIARSSAGSASYAASATWPAFHAQAVPNGIRLPSASKPITVSIASADHALVDRLAIGIDRFADIALVGISPGARHSRIADLIDGASPAVLVLDAVLVEAADAEVEHQPSPDAAPANIVLMLDAHTPRGLDLLLAVRARGCVPRDVDIDALVRAIRAVATGESWLPRWGLDRLYWRTVAERLATAQSLRSDAGKSLLTRREADVFELARAGLTNKGIGRQLGISASTVKKHLHATFEKYGVRRRRQLLR